MSEALPSIIQNKIIYYCWELTWLDEPFYSLKEAQSIANVNWHWFEQSKIWYNQNDRRTRVFNPFQDNTADFIKHLQNRYCMMESISDLWIERIDDEGSINGSLAGNALRALSNLVFGTQIDAFLKITNKAIAAQDNNDKLMEQLYHNCTRLTIMSTLFGQLSEKEVVEKVAPILNQLVTYKTNNATSQPLVNVSCNINEEQDSQSELIKELLPIRRTIRNLQVDLLPRLDQLLKGSTSLKTLELTMEQNSVDPTRIFNSFPPQLESLSVISSHQFTFPFNQCKSLTALHIQDPNIKINPDNTYIDFLSRSTNLVDVGKYAHQIYTTEEAYYQNYLRVLASKTSLHRFKFLCFTEDPEWKLPVHDQVEYLSLTTKVVPSNLNDYIYLRELVINFNNSSVLQVELDKITDYISKHTDRLKKLSLIDSNGIFKTKSDFTTLFKAINKNGALEKVFISLPQYLLYDPTAYRTEDNSEQDLIFDETSGEFLSTEFINSIVGDRFNVVERDRDFFITLKYN